MRNCKPDYAIDAVRGGAWNHLNFGSLPTRELPGLKLPANKKNECIRPGTPLSLEAGSNPCSMSALSSRRQ
ncbi:MAG: hypothetical protein ACRD2U_05460 [Terriglobales bacterium]